MEQTFTVIGTYYDNNQGWAGDFVAADSDDAITKGGPATLWPLTPTTPLPRGRRR